MENYTQFLEAQRFTIFLFHGVIRQRRHAIRNYTDKHLVLDRFAALMQNLRTQGVPVSMPEIVAANDSGGTLPERAFAITFDDGFENNFSVAGPVLRDLGVPATFYITTGFIESNTPSWIDMIEYAVEKTDRFCLTFSSPQFHGEYATPEEKRALLDQIRRVVKNDRNIDPYQFAHRVWDQLGITSMDPDPDLDQKMSWEQIQELHRDNLFTIGGHSHTHRILEYLEQSDLEHEVALSLEKLRAHLDIPITHYSYPEGLANCYSDRVINVLRRHGIVCAPTAEHGTNKVGDDLFHLKRILVTL